MDLTNEDVTDILALLDSLPYDEFDLQTPRFRLTLRRTPDGWMQAVEARAEPTMVDVVSAVDPGVAATVTGAAAVTGASTPAAAAASTATPTTGPMVHWAGDNRPDVPLGRLSLAWGSLSLRLVVLEGPTLLRYSSGGAAHSMRS